MCSGGTSPKQTAVTDITVWTYYNGDQLESFTKLVDEFNSTVGAEKGISVFTESLGSVNDLEASVMDAAEGKVGASELPKIFSAYADTAYAMDQILSVRKFEEALDRIQLARPCTATAEGDKLLTVRKDGATRYIMLRVTADRLSQIGLAEDVPAAIPAKITPAARQVIANCRIAEEG